MTLFPKQGEPETARMSFASGDCQVVTLGQESPRGFQ
jgi:hypothetical protein